jgi:hypothetical protein
MKIAEWKVTITSEKAFSDADLLAVIDDLEDLNLKEEIKSILSTHIKTRTVLADLKVTVEEG